VRTPHALSFATPDSRARLEGRRRSKLPPRFRAWPRHDANVGYWDRHASAFRAGRHRDWGRSRFGSRTDAEFKRRFPRFEGRNVDLFATAIAATPGQDPAAAVQAWLSDAGGRRAKLLAEKAFVMLEPRRLEIVWPLDARGEPLRGYRG
jgi:hypothetical protein